MTHLFSLLPAHPEYLDPGSGSLLIQMILAAVLGIGVGIRIFWKSIKAFFNRNKVTDSQSEDPTSIVDDPTALPEEKSDNK